MSNTRQRVEREYPARRRTDSKLALRGRSLTPAASCLSGQFSFRPVPAGALSVPQPSIEAEAEESAVFFGIREPDIHEVVPDREGRVEPLVGQRIRVHGHDVLEAAGLRPLGA